VNINETRYLKQGVRRNVDVLIGMWYELKY